MELTSASTLPTALYRAADVRELDRQAIEVHGIPGARLMKRAGRAAYEAMLAHWPQVQAITVFCGRGNNAGDGYVIAGLAAQRRLQVRVVQVGDPEKLKGDALAACEFARQEGVAAIGFAEDMTFPSAGVLVDALLGTGTSGTPREPYARAIAAINRSGLPVMAVDIPSGLCADTGCVLGVQAVVAQLTPTFIGVKRGLLTGRGPAFAGKVRFFSLDVPVQIYSQVPAGAERLDLSRLLEKVPPRPADAHKGLFGHVMIIGGDAGLGGAAAMAAEAAARVGAGLVSVATRPQHVAALLARCPELMVCGVDSGQELEPLLQRPDVLVIGPGLGRSPWSEQMLRQAVQSGLPLVVDADALNILSEGRVVPEAHRGDWILTPHPGEAARLLGCANAEVQADRFAAVAKLQQIFGGTAILKGAGTLVKGEEPLIGLANVGNPGMACGGMGDVLSGILGGLLAQGLEQGLAARLGVCLHGVAGDLAAENGGQRGMLATDLIPYVRRLLNGVDGQSGG